MCPKWIFVKVKVLSAGLDCLTTGWMFSLRNFSMYIPKNGQACCNTWTLQTERGRLRDIVHYVNPTQNLFLPMWIVRLF